MVGLKLAQAWGCPCSIKCLFKDIRSHSFPPPPPSPYSPFSYWLFWKLADRHKCAQPIGEMFPTQPLFLCSECSLVRSWLWDKESYSQLRRRIFLWIQSLSMPEELFQFQWRHLGSTPLLKNILLFMSNKTKDIRLLDIKYYDLYSPVHNVLDECISITWASGKGLGPGNLKFFGPQMALTFRLDVISQGPKNSQFPWPNPLPLAHVNGCARIQNIMHGAVLIIQ